VDAKYRSVILKAEGQKSHYKVNAYMRRCVYSLDLSAVIYKASRSKVKGHRQGHRTFWSSRTNCI